jgi:bla regulator protein BlaR1
MLCILYVIVIGACLGLVGLFAEHARPVRSPRRWIWCVTISLSVLAPPLSKARHAIPVRELLEHEAFAAPGGSTGPIDGGARFALLDSAWWAESPAYDVIINPLWLVSSGVLLFWALVHASFAARLVWSSRSKVTGSRGPAIVDGVEVVVTESIGPATVGLRRATIMMPEWVLGLPAGERSYVLRHEEEHRSARDPLLLFVASLALVLTPWNLPLYWQIRRLRLAVEIDCDNRVLRELGDAARYASLLLAIADASSRDHRLQPAFAGSVGNLEQRLKNLMADRKHMAVLILASILACALLGAALMMPHPVLAHHAHSAPPRRG